MVLFLNSQMSCQQAFWQSFNALLYPTQRRANMEVDATFGKVSMSCCISDILLHAKVISFSQRHIFIQFVVIRVFEKTLRLWNSYIQLTLVVLEQEHDLSCLPTKMHRYKINKTVTIMSSLR
jgi:hypothetical protein